MASFPLCVEFFKEDVLGIGSYGKVCKAKCGQLPCAAKLLHETLFLYGDPGESRFTEKFVQEGQFLSSIKHPNVVQYLATVRHPQSGRPVLLMELMEESLTTFLERRACPPPYHAQLDICHDVTLALSYLHANHIIHRDLSSNNVLLMGSGVRAKVTDFGMSRLMDMNPQKDTLTKCPGTTVYMSPEALTDSPHYSEKLDCFSWGVLTVQVITGNFPTPTRSFREDSRFPTERVIVLVPEVDRRKKDIDQIEAEHPLRPEALRCLKDKDTERHSTDELCEKLAVLKGEKRYKESLQQEGSQPSQAELEAKERKNRQLIEKEEVIQNNEKEIKTCREQLKEKETLIQAKVKEIETSSKKLEKKEQVIQEKEREVETCHEQLKEKERKREGG